MTIRAKPHLHALVIALSLSAVLLFLSTATQRPSQAAVQLLINRKLSGEMQPEGDVIDYAISPDSRYAMFMADAELDGAYELYSVRTTGETDPITLNTPLPA